MNQHSLLKDLQKDLAKLGDKFGDLRKLPNKIAADIIQKEKGLSKEDAHKLSQMNFNELAEKGLTLDEALEEVKSRM